VDGDSPDDVQTVCIQTFWHYIFCNFFFLLCHIKSWISMHFAMWVDKFLVHVS
jgi:hypothetical protein